MSYNSNDNEFASHPEDPMENISEEAVRAAQSATWKLLLGPDGTPNVASLSDSELIVLGAGLGEIANAPEYMPVLRAAVEAELKKRGLPY